MSYWRLYEHACIISDYSQAWIFVDNYFCIGALEILCHKIQFKSEFGQAHCEEWFKRIHTKFILIFLDISTSLYKFWKCALFSRII
jgi:hypothetical protein